MTKTRIYTLFSILALMLAVGSVLFVSPTASAEACRNSDGVMGFPAWYKGLECDAMTGGGQTVNVSGDINKIWIIVMNIVQWLIVAAGYVAVFFIIFGGFKYIVAKGEPDKINNARVTIINAIIGLIIVLASVAFIRTIQASISGVIT